MSTSISIQKIGRQKKQNLAMETYTLFSVAVHELGYSLGLFHCNKKDSVMQPFYQHGFSVENKNEILGQSDIENIQEMYGKIKTVEVRAIYNSKKAKIMIRMTVKPSKSKKAKIIFTLKPSFFSESIATGSETSGVTGDFEEQFVEQFEVQFQKLLKRLCGLDMAKRIKICVV